MEELAVGLLDMLVLLVALVEALRARIQHNLGEALLRVILVVELVTEALEDHQTGLTGPVAAVVQAQLVGTE